MKGIPRQTIGAFLLLMLPGCLSTESPRRERPLEEGFALVILEGGEVLQVELADTPEKRVRGYMFRERVGPDDGMLFPFPAAAFHSIWMKNCLVPLDIIWIEAGRVVHIEENVPPCEPDQPCLPYVPLQRALYVLELAGGAAARRGIGLGTGMQVVMGPDENGSH